MQLFQPVEPILTALPVTPVDGQIINFLADDTNGVVWRLRYRAASASAYKWEFLGGPPIASIEQGATDNIVGSTGTMTDFATNPGPSLTLPLAGDYMLNMAAWVQAPANTGGHASVVGLQFGAVAPTDADGMINAGVATTVSAVTACAKEIRRNGLTGATLVVKMVGRCTNPTGGAASRRSFTARPVRVG